MKSKDLMSTVSDLIMEHHLHPISVHIPNGVLPVSVIFVAMAVVFDIRVLDQAAFYNMIFIVLTIPVVLLTGFVEWKNRYGGKMTKVFKRKIISAVVVAVLAVFLVGWRFFDPDVATTSSNVRWLYLLVHVIILGASGIAGYYGGKFVFQARDNMLRRKAKSPDQSK